MPRRGPGEGSAGERGFTLIEVLAVVAIVVILAAMGVPALVRARMTANEVAAIGSLRAVNSGEAAYAASAAGGAYATQLSVLAQPCPGSTTGFIAPDMANDPTSKSGYTIALAAGVAGAGPNDCNGAPTNVGYYVTAIPRVAGMTGLRGFASSHRGIIFFDPSGVAPPEAAMLAGGGGTPIQ